MQREEGEKKTNWVTNLQEYDIDIRPTKIKGQGFFQIAYKSFQPTSR